MCPMQEYFLLQSQLPACSLESRTQTKLRCLLRGIMKASDESLLSPVLVAAKIFTAVSGGGVVIGNELESRVGATSLLELLPL